MFTSSCLKLHNLLFSVMEETDSTKSLLYSSFPREAYSCAEKSEKNKNLRHIFWTVHWDITEKILTLSWKAQGYCLYDQPKIYIKLKSSQKLEKHQFSFSLLLSFLSSSFLEFTYQHFINDENKKTFIWWNKNKIIKLTFKIAHSERVYGYFHIKKY
jgi:hypothetical protein